MCIPHLAILTIPMILLMECNALPHPVTCSDVLIIPVLSSEDYTGFYCVEMTMLKCQQMLKHLNHRASRQNGILNTYMYMCLVVSIGRSSY